MENGSYPSEPKIDKEGIGYLIQELERQIEIMKKGIKDPDSLSNISFLFVCKEDNRIDILHRSSVVTFSSMLFGLISRTKFEHMTPLNIVDAIRSMIKQNEDEESKQE